MFDVLIYDDVHLMALLLVRPILLVRAETPLVKRLTLDWDNASKGIDRTCWGENGHAVCHRPLKCSQTCYHQLGRSTHLTTSLSSLVQVSCAPAAQVDLALELPGFVG